MLKEVDNFFPVEIQNQIYSALRDKSFPWYFSPAPDLSKSVALKTLCDNDNNIKLHFGFTNMLFRRTIKECDIMINDTNLTDLFINYTEKTFNLKVNLPIRILASLSLPDSNYNTDDYLLPHVDFFVKHKTLIYYVNDSDGDTFIFKEICRARDITRKSNLEKLLEIDDNFSKKTILSRVTPAQGKAVLFNGTNYHSGSIPRQNLRYVINFNFK